MVFAHITSFDVASLLPSAVAILVLGVALGVSIAPRFSKKFSSRGDR